jgi:hypothetical protein
VKQDELNRDRRRGSRGSKLEQVENIKSTSSTGNTKVVWALRIAGIDGELS